MLGVGPPPKTMAAPFDWHAHRTPRTPDGEIQEPPAEVVDYLEAVKSGDVDMLRSAIARGAHVDTHHRCGMSGLIIAADAGHSGVVECLLEHRADVNFLWSMQTALFYAERRKDGLEGEGLEIVRRRRRTHELLAAASKANPAPTPPATPPPTPQLDDPPLPPKPPLLYKATATEDNIKELLQVIANAAVSDLNREDAAWALRVMTEPALAQRKRNTGLLINLGAVDPLVDMLVNGATHGCKEQAIAVLRNIARETSQRKVGHKIRKVIRQEAAKWAGLGTPESDARIAEMERTIAERGGVCVVKSDEEIARLMAEREAQLDSS